MSTHHTDDQIRQHRIDAAARELLARHTEGRSGDGLPADARPQDATEALAIQRRVLTLLDARVGGWKCSLPQQQQPVLAPVYAHRITQVQQAGACAAPLVEGSAEIEPEIAYVIGNDLPPRATPYSEAEVLQAVASTHLVFELIGSRYNDRSKESFAVKLADCLANYGLFVGPAIDNAHNQGDTLSTLPLTLHDGAAELGRWNGKHPDGHPLKPLHWLANYLAANGSGLQRGQVVTTGSYHGVIRVPAERALRMQFGTLGTLAVTIHAA